MLKHRNEEPEIAHYLKSHPRKRKIPYYPSVEPPTHNYNYNYHHYYNLQPRQSWNNMHLPFHHQFAHDERRQPQSDVNSGIQVERRNEYALNPYQRLDVVHPNGSLSFESTSTNHSSQHWSEKRVVDSNGSVSSIDSTDELFDPIPWDVYRNEPIVEITSPIQSSSSRLNQFNPKSGYTPPEPRSAVFTPGTQRFGYDQSGYPPVATPPYVLSSEAIPNPTFSIPFYPSHCPPHPYQHHYVTPIQEHGREWANSHLHRDQYSSMAIPSKFSKCNKSNLKNPAKKTKNSRKRQPRPKIFVLEGQGGIVFHPRPDDILSGRGGRINSHIGNVRYRQLVAQYKQSYLDPLTKKLEKSHIAADIVNKIRQRGGRFLAENDDGSWLEVGDVRAIRKTGQALREVAQPIRISASTGSYDDTEAQESVDSRSTSSAASSPTLTNIESVCSTDRTPSPTLLSPPFRLTDSNRVDSIGSFCSLLSAKSSECDPVDGWLNAEEFSD
jgi:hypothetical protein